MLIKKNVSLLKLVILFMILVFVVLIGELNGITSQNLPQTSSSTISPALAFTIDLSWPQLYVGDPLRIEARLNSPQAQQATAKRMIAQSNDTKLAQPELTLPEIAVDWASTVELTLYKLQSKGNKQLILSGNLIDYLEGRDNSEVTAFPLQGAAIDCWLIPADRARLSEGTYQIQAVWNGKGKVNETIIGAKGKLNAEPITFTVRTPKDNYENGQHSYRLALSAYTVADYTSAKSYGQKTLSYFANQLKPELIETYIIIGNAQLGLDDYRAALATYNELLDKMPDKQSDMAAIIKVRVKNLEKLIANIPK